MESRWWVLYYLRLLEFKHSFRIQFLALFGKKVCPICNKADGTVERRRLCTKYEDLERNYVTYCESCYNDLNNGY